MSKMHSFLLFALLFCSTVVGLPEHILAQTTSRGRALIVGVNKYHEPDIPSTPGSVEDAEAIKQLIMSNGWYKEEDIKILTNSEATADCIRKNFEEWLINGSNPGDRILFFYSGHGSRVPDEDGDEMKSDPTDKFDEVIAPHDVKIVNNSKLDNYISDDQFNKWIERLGGRSIVMIFDSCHSGTVTRSIELGSVAQEKVRPRYLPGPDEWDWSARTRSTTDGPRYEVLENDVKSRDLNLVYDKERVTPNSLLTVISAAQSGQLAWPMLTNEGKPGGSGIRGALTYYIEKEILHNPRVTLSELFDLVSKDIKEAQHNGKLYGHQTPKLEVSSGSLMNDKPLFSSIDIHSAISRIMAGISSQSQIKQKSRIQKPRIKLTAEVGRWTNGKFVTDRTDFCYQEKIGYRITTDTPGYLYIIVFSQKDVVTVLHPKLNERLNNSGESYYGQYHVQEPPGKDLVVVLLTHDKLDESINSDIKDVSWKRMFDLLGSQDFKMAVTTRGQANITSPARTLDSTEWQAVVLTTGAYVTCDGLPKH